MSSSIPISWIALTSLEQLVELDQHSHNSPVLIFKHSTRCSISELAWRRMQSKEGILFSHRLPCFYLDIFKHRPLSDQIARDYNVFHESPQVLLIKDGECFYESSHLDIDVGEMEEQLAAVENKI